MQQTEVGAEIGHGHGQSRSRGENGGIHLAGHHAQLVVQMEAMVLLLLLRLLWLLHMPMGATALPGIHHLVPAIAYGNSTAGGYYRKNQQ